jgi:hypothetical protein
MPAATTKKKEFPKPAKPYTSAQLKRKVKGDRDYGKFLHGHLKKAKKGDSRSAEILKQHFKTTPKEGKHAALAAALCTEIQG